MDLGIINNEVVGVDLDSAISISKIELDSKS